MAVTFADYINFMKTATTLKPRARFEFLNQDETVMKAFSAEVTGGSLSCNRANGVRRTCNLNVCNFYDDFTPSPMGIWVNQKFKLYLGYNINSEDYFLPQGVFVTSDPQILHQGGKKEGSISGIDKFGLLDGQLGGNLYVSYIIPVNSNVINALKAILVDARINDPKTPLLLIDAAMVTPNTITESYPQAFSDLGLNLNDILAYNMYYDYNGRFRCEPDTLNSIKAVSWEFNTNTSKIPLSINNAYDFKNAYNIVTVIGNNIEGNLAKGIARNDDPSSPLSTLRIGEKPAKPITSSVISTDAQAQARANFEITRYTTLGISTSINCVPLFHLDADQIVSVTDDYLNFNEERFLINSFDISFGPATVSMDISTTRAKDLDFEITES